MCKANKAFWAPGLQLQSLWTRIARRKMKNRNSSWILISTTWGKLCMDEPQLQFRIALCCSENAPACQRNNIFSNTIKQRQCMSELKNFHKYKKHQHFIFELIVVGKEEQQARFQLRRSLARIWGQKQWWWWWWSWWWLQWLWWLEGAGDDDDDGVEMKTIIMRMKMMCSTTMIRRRRFYIKLAILV